MENLIQLNENIFFWINQNGGHHYTWLDSIMIFLSDDINSIILFSIVSIFAFWRDGKSAWRVIALLGVLVVVSDWSGTRLKYWFVIERPCQSLEGVRLLLPCFHYSFPSNHAINMAAAATFIGWHYHVLIAPMAVLALLVGISRVYVGVHYPGDVLFGWIWGGLVAAPYYWICCRIIPNIYHQKRTVSNIPELIKDKDFEEKK